MMLMDSERMYRSALTHWSVDVAPSTPYRQHSNYNTHTTHN